MKFLESYDWTKRQLQLKQLAEQIAGAISYSRPSIQKLSSDVKESLEKLSARESSLSKHAELSLSELAATQVNLQIFSKISILHFKMYNIEIFMK